ncbi:MAG: hypothetical protein AAFN13_12360, partial [Bacteroidota bacterium]
ASAAPAGRATRWTWTRSFSNSADPADTPTPDQPPDTTAVDAISDTVGDLGALGSDAVATLFENDLVHVHRVALPAGATLAAHDGGERVVYALSDLALTFTTDGEATEHTFEIGGVHYHEAGTHAVANVGEGTAEFLVFERRGGALPEAGAPEAMLAAEGATDEVLFENNFAEVHRVTLQPGAALPPHQGFARAVYSLSGYTVEFTDAEGSRVQRYEAGQAHYHDPGDHTVENADDTVAEFLVVEFKPGA